MKKLSFGIIILFLLMTEAASTEPKKSKSTKKALQQKPAISTQFDEADALLGKRTQIKNRKSKNKKKAEKPALPTINKTPTPGGPVPIPYPNIGTIDKKPKKVTPGKKKP